MGSTTSIASVLAPKMSSPVMMNSPLPLHELHFDAMQTRVMQTIQCKQVRAGE
jgi:hypothetical protein